LSAVLIFSTAAPPISTGTEPEAPKLTLGYTSVIAAHTLFTMSLVIVLVRARVAGIWKKWDHFTAIVSRTESRPRKQKSSRQAGAVLQS